MTATEIDGYLAALPQPKRGTLERLREDIRAAIPDAEECISYGLPAFRLEGKIVAGFGAFKDHLSYLPHSGSVLPALAEQLSGYGQTKGSLHFPVDQPLAKDLVVLLIRTRLLQLGIPD